MVHEDRKKKAYRRKCSARIWWIGVHVYDSAIIAHNYVEYSGVISSEEYALFIVVSIITSCLYILVQCSTPGYAEDLSDGQLNHPEADIEANTGNGHIDTDLLVPKEELSSVSLNGDMVVEQKRFCDQCQIVQPIRSKHCRDCGRCVKQYDHHCDCVGTCVGEENRSKFLVYLCFQLIESYWALGVSASYFTLESSVDDWFKKNSLLILVWCSTFVSLLLLLPLLGYQIYLISTNQTSWEHSRRSKISYLQHLPDGVLPFNRGCFRNWSVFICNGDMNKWVHRN